MSQASLESLRENGISVNRVVQKLGQFVVTLPKVRLADDSSKVRFEPKVVYTVTIYIDFLAAEMVSVLKSRKRN